MQNQANKYTTFWFVSFSAGIGFGRIFYSQDGRFFDCSKFEDWLEKKNGTTGNVIVLNYKQISQMEFIINTSKDKSK